MKKINILLIVLIFSLVVSACNVNNPLSNSQSSVGQSIQSSLSLSQLAAGSLLIMDSTNTITKDQATELIQLWKIYEDVSSSDTAASEELDALCNQIQGTMNSTQLAAIINMKLTFTDIQSLAEEQGYGSSTAKTQSISKTVTQSNNGTMGSSGAPAGGVSMGGMPSGGDEVSQLMTTSTTGSTAVKTSNTQTVTSKTTSKVTLTLVDALITKLQSLY